MAAVPCALRQTHLIFGEVDQRGRLPARAPDGRVDSRSWGEITKPKASLRERRWNVVADCHASFVQSPATPPGYLRLPVSSMLVVALAVYLGWSPSAAPDTR